MSSANARWRRRRACSAGCESRSARISDKPIYVFQVLVQYLETHRVVAPGYSFLQDLLANCIIYYNACILSELLERAERRQDWGHRMGGGGRRRVGTFPPGRLINCHLRTLDRSE